MLFKKHKNKKILELINLWNKPKKEDFNFDLIEHYFIGRDNSSAFQIVSSQTINDIDFCELFSAIDRTNSKIGQQYLFNKLLTIDTDTHFNEQELIVNYFVENEKTKIEMQTLLSKLNKRTAYYICNLFLDGYIQKPKWFWCFKILSALSLVALIFTFIFNKIFLILLGIYTTNMILHFWNKKNIMVYTDSIPQLPLLCKVAEELTKLNIIPQCNSSINASIKSLREMGKAISFFKTETNMKSDIEALIFFFLENIKILFLIEPLIVFYALKKLDSKRKDIQALFEYVGKIDSAISIARLRTEMSCCKPILSNTSKTLEFTDIYHPLISDCAPNSLKITGKSILLTGSNMSGKTTFIRTVAVNVLLAQTINTCFAKEFKLCPMRLFSAIRISDDLLNDKSYYFEEVLTIKNMVSESQSTTNNLFLLDEIFKGTNTIERIAAGKAVLSYLTKSNHNIVFVSTHDVELAGLLNNAYDLYHFTEIIQEGQIHFDYKLKTGHLATKNAIRILKINDYPKEIIEEAQKLSNSLQQNNNK